MGPWRTSVLIVLLSLPMATGATAVATEVAHGNTPAGEVSMEQAVRMVEQRYRARVVKAESRKDNGRTTYVLKLLDDSGKVWTVHVDAASGAVQ
jgi:uncharacterized membrane protein YkoI